MCHPMHSAARERRACCGPSDRAFRYQSFEHHHYVPDSFAGGFGVRRPLRFLAFKLGLDEAQIAGLAAVLDELKTERAQGAVDDRRALALLADAAAGESFDAAKSDEAARIRVQSAERVQRKVSQALERMHGLFNAEQRARLAYLLRTGALVM